MECFLKGLVKTFFCSLVRMRTKNNWIILKFVKLDPCDVANLLGCKVCISVHVRMFIIFDCVPESIKKSISRSGD